MMDAQGSSCKSCVDKSCTPAFETCSGLTPPSKAFFALGALETATDACKDAADQKVWDDEGKDDFESDLSKCGNQCLGGATCTTDCIKKLRGYTEACSTCFGDLVGCTKDNCMFDCMLDANGSSCKNCVNKSCTPSFETCSGLTPPATAATLEAATDACKDAADQKKWNGNGKTDFASDLSKCGNKCLGTAACSTDCIKKLGYTEGCSTCFGDLVGCTKDNCMFDCMMDAQGSSCKSCVDKNCTPAFETCSGLTPPSN